ncbi:hypothetical protein BDP81DRAFT_412508 [Colletotrichum phormii]|uniref:Uncharacterized protein n=1 Tax=Colletotrichum phormii TaxID=359342 RepID=A0AAJ0A3M6_9PEZI|nr:uncharacterized protein BDP81DRAFT_412508 [Colletotrichum phormii]KAK1655343.1 hypothetical protein BDP81DRAFT_412508 [Colletotrichum phormii]
MASNLACCILSLTRNDMRSVSSLSMDVRRPHSANGPAVIRGATQSLALDNLGTPFRARAMELKVLPPALSET